MMAKPADVLDLSDLLHELTAQYGGVPIHYHRLWELAAGARFPARRIGRVWHVQRADVPLIAATLGLTEPPAAA